MHDSTAIMDTKLREVLLGYEHEYMQNKFKDSNFIKKITQREYAEKTTMADRVHDTSWADGL